MPPTPFRFRSSRALVASLLLGILTPASVVADRSDDPRPNIILIVADDVGYGHLGSYGQALIQTPELDQMAVEGLRFTHFYAGAPSCLPSRVSLMTGLHGGHQRVRTNGASGTHPPIAAEDTCVSTALREAGYLTGMIGKWALGDNFIGNTISSKNLDGSGAVYKHGWDFYLGEPNQTFNNDYYPANLYRYDPDGLLPGLGSATSATELVTFPMADDPATTDFAEDFTMDRYTRTALEFIDTAKDEPFFLYLPYTAIHPNQVVPELEPYTVGQSWSSGAKVEASLLTRMDRDIGRLLDRLATYGIEDDTLVLFTSDNGAASNNNALFNNNGPLSGFKHTLTEGGLRVPCIAWWPGKIAPGGVSSELLAFWDIMPTFSALAGITAPEPIDGLSFVPTLLGQPGQQSHDYLYFYLTGGNYPGGGYYVVPGPGETRSSSEINDAAFQSATVVPTFTPRLTVTNPSALFSPGDPLPAPVGQGGIEEGGRPTVTWTLPDGIAASFDASQDLQSWFDSGEWFQMGAAGGASGASETRSLAVRDPIPPELFSRATYEAYAEPALVPEVGSPPDTTPPVGTGSTVVTEGASLSLSFDENIQKSSGNILIRRSSDDSIVETIDVSSMAVIVSGNSAIITPSSPLVLGTAYYIEIAPGAFEDLAGNSFAGFSGNAAWTFTVTAAPVFVAYHDFGETTPLPGNVTVHTIGAAETTTSLNSSAVELVQLTDGAPTGVFVTVAGANGTDLRSGVLAAPAPGDPADALFNGVGIGFGTGLLFEGGGGAGATTVTLTGLNPSQTYDLALVGGRTTPADAAERFTLGRVDDFPTNLSSSGIVDAVTTDQDTRGTPPPGEVIRWADINPGADGTIVFTMDPEHSDPDNIAYLSAMRLAASGGTIGTDVQSDYWYQSSVSNDGNGPLDLLAELNYNDGQANAPIAVVMHGYSPATGNLGNVRPPAQRLRDNGFFAISVAMRGRDGSDGVRDSGGVEIHDIIDAVEAVKADSQFTGLIDPGNVHITGYSGGGGNVMSALTKFPDYFRLGSAFFGMSDYGFDPANGWYNNGAGGRTSQLNTDIGNPNTGGDTVLDGYHARASNLASRNNPYSEIHLFVNNNETICPVINSTSYRDNAVAAEMTPGEFDNITAHIGGSGAYEDFNGNSVNDSNELQSWPHGVPNADRQDAGELWYRDRLLAGTIPQPVLNDSDALFVAGFVKTGKFDLWLGDGQNAAGDLTYSLSDTQMSFSLAVASNDLAVTGRLEIDTARMNGETVLVKLDGLQVDSFTGGGTYTYTTLGHNETLTLMTGTDTTTPAVTSTVPADDATGVPVGTDLTLTFNEPVAQGTGSIIIRLASDDSVVETIDVSTGSVSVSGSEVTVDISPLATGTSYYVEVGAGTFLDLSGNSFGGVSGNSSWNFTTASGPLFVSYHDFGEVTGSDLGNITVHTFGADGSTSSLNTGAVELKRYSDGILTGVSVTIAGANGTDLRSGVIAAPAASDPAAALFNGVGLGFSRGLIFEGGNNGSGATTVTLTGLDPALRYGVAFVGGRLTNGDANERFTLSGADGTPTNSSSTGTVDAFTTDQDTRGNPVPGEFVRWENIDPGADGQIVVTMDPEFSSLSNIAYLSAMRLECIDPGL